MDRLLRVSATFGAVVRNLAATGRARKQAISIVADCVIVLLSLWAAFTLRLGVAFVDFLSTPHLFIVMPLATVALFASLGIYRWMVRASNRRLYAQLVKGSMASAVLLLSMLYLFPLPGANPRSLFIIYALTLIIGTCSTRLLWGSLFDAGKKGMPIAIYGAGSAGVQLASSLAGAAEYRPVCFIDDSLDLRNTTVFGLPVLHADSSELLDEVKRREVNQVVIAIPSLSSDAYERVIQRLESLDLPFKTMPGFAELVSGQAQFHDIRDISIGDILGRSEVPPDPVLMKHSVAGRSVMVTGGGGSIGSELCRQIIQLNPSRLVVVDNCESGLYHITEEIEAALITNEEMFQIDFVPVLCSIQDKRRIPHLLALHEIDVIFHAAAYKHVPIVERFPGQAVDVNIFGTLNLVDAAIDARVRSFVLISTDKAVRPTNSMGATKRVAELILQAKARDVHDTTISMVRFGNVLGSSGSVVPKFRAQIDAGGPVTLTHEDITRYFMTIPEAAQLVVQASAIASPGSVFVLDMGKPVKILHLAKTMIRMHQRKLRLAGLSAPNLKIVTTGLRSGEKMHEELFLGNNCEPTTVAKVMRAQEPMLEWTQLHHHLLTLEDLAATASAAELKSRLIAIIESTPQPQAKIVNVALAEDTRCEREAQPALSIG